MFNTTVQKEPAFSSLKMGWWPRRLRTGFVMVLLIICKNKGATMWGVEAEGGTDIPEVSLTEVSPPPRDCWIFNHLNKAGGSTVKYMLSPWIEEHNISLGLYDSTQWSSGPEFAQQFLQDKYMITWGAYTDGLRPHGGQNCKWFTIFRHPIERLVSAYFYCRKGAVDGVCGTHIVNAQEVDLVTFARHWGNFGLRQFMYGDIPVSAVAYDSREKDSRYFPAWWKMKHYIEGLAINSSAVTATAAASATENLMSIEYPALKTFLAPVLERLSTRYAAVGTIEDWPTTLRLFDAALNLPSFDWAKAFHRIGTKNSNHAFLGEAEDALRSARTNPDIYEFIRLDMLLYEHALEVHAKQVEDYGIGDE